MKRDPYFFVVGFDFGTSYSKVVIHDQNRQTARVATFGPASEWLIPSLVGFHENCLLPPFCSSLKGAIPYLKMLASQHCLQEGFTGLGVHWPVALDEASKRWGREKLLDAMLSWYFANVLAGVRREISGMTPFWARFDFKQKRIEDFWTVQMGIPTAYLGEKNVRTFMRRCLVTGFRLSSDIDSTLQLPVRLDRWMKQCVDMAAEYDESQCGDDCYVYPEVAAGIQTVMRTQNADGLYLTMDVGAGTVDLNVFRRFSGHKKNDGTFLTTLDKSNLDYYASAVAVLGAARIQERRYLNPYANRPQAVDCADWGVDPIPEGQLMVELDREITALMARARKKQRNLGQQQGQRTYDSLKVYGWGGGYHIEGYGTQLARSLAKDIWTPDPMLLPIPSRDKLKMPKGADFDRLSIAYGLSFHRSNLESVRLTNEIEDHPQPPPRDPWDDGAPKPGDPGWATRDWTD